MSDDRDWRTYTRRGALGLMGIGGVVGVGETLGFTSLTNSRGVNVDVANDDQEAVFQIEGEVDGDTDTLDGMSFDVSGNSQEDELTVKLTNLLGQSIAPHDLRVSIKNTDPRTYLEVDLTNTSLSPTGDGDKGGDGDEFTLAGDDSEEAIVENGSEIEDANNGSGDASESIVFDTGNHILNVEFKIENVSVNGFEISDVDRTFHIDGTTDDK